MKPFRVYEFKNARLLKPAKDKKIKHDYDTFDEANSKAHDLSEVGKSQVLIVHYAKPREGNIVGIVKWSPDK